MKIEHWALNVQDPLAATDWYCKNFGMRVVRQGEPPSTVRFLADDNGVKFEIYHNASAPVLDFPNLHPQTTHLAFKVEDMAKEHARLVAAGATPIAPINKNPNGNEMAMLRDPWGLVIQLAKRPDF